MEVNPARLAVDILSSLGSCLEEMVRAPLDEIRGNLTSEVVREWVEGTSTLSIPGTTVALHRDRSRNTVMAVVLGPDKQPLVDAQGKPIANVFSAKKIAPDLLRLFDSKDLVILM